MTREDARKAAEIMQAYAEGKELEVRAKGTGKWQTIDVPAFNWCDFAYRIKPQPKYRPFQSAEECWQEMQKHQPFGWVKDEDGAPMLITRLEESQYMENFCVWFSDCNVAAKRLFQDTTFADGTPFGVKEAKA